MKTLVVGTSVEMCWQG